MSDTHDDLMWTVRHFIYRYLVEHELPPSVEQTAAGLAIGTAEAENAYRRLNDHHAILLEPGSLTIRIANPFSGAPTPFRVYANGHTYWANCAWDTLGIPAALHSDARIEAVHADTQAPTEIRIEHGTVYGNGELVHLPVPYQNWHDDLVHT